MSHAPGAILPKSDAGEPKLHVLASAPHSVIREQTGEAHNATSIKLIELFGGKGEIAGHQRLLG